jgi:hypothetical protein
MNLPLFSRLLQLSVSLGMDLLLTTGEHVLRRDVANGAIQADIVLQLRDQTPIKLRHGKSNIARIRGMAVRSWWSASAIEGA